MTIVEQNLTDAKPLKTSKEPKTMVVDPETMKKMPQGKPYHSKTLFQRVVDDIKWALGNNI